MSGYACSSGCIFLASVLLAMFLPIADAQSSANSSVAALNFPPAGLALWWNPSSWIIDTINPDDTSFTHSLKLAIDESTSTAAGVALSDSSFVGVPLTVPGNLAPPLVVAAQANSSSERSSLLFNAQYPSTLQIQSEGRVRSPSWYDSHSFLVVAVNSSCVTSSSPPDTGNSGSGCVLLSHRAMDDAATSSFTEPSLTLFVDSTSTLSLTVRFPIRSANETYASSAQIAPSAALQETTIRLPAPIPLTTNVVLHLSLHTVLPPPPYVQTTTTITNVTHSVYVDTADGGTEIQQRIEPVATTTSVTITSAELIQTNVTLEAWIPSDNSNPPTRVLRVSSPLPAGADLRSLADAASFIGGFGSINQLARNHPTLGLLKPFSGSLLELQVYSTQVNAGSNPALTSADADSVGDLLASIWLHAMARPSVAPPANTQPSSVVISSPAPEFLVPIVNDTGVVRTPAGLSYLPRYEQEALRVTFNFLTLNLTNSNAAIMGLLNDIRALLGLSVNSTALQFVSVDVAKQIPIIDFVPALDSPSNVNSPYRAVMRLADALDSGEGYANPRYEYLAQLSRDRELRMSFTAKDPIDDEDSSNSTLRRQLLIGILVPTLLLICILGVVAFILYGRNGELRVALQKRILEFTKRVETVEDPVMVGTAGLETDDPRRFQLESLQLHRCKGCRLLQCADTVPLQDADPLEVSKANIDVGELRQRHRAMLQQARESSLALGSSLRLDVADNWGESPQRVQPGLSPITRYPLSVKNGPPTVEMASIQASPRGVKSPSMMDADRPPWGWRPQPPAATAIATETITQQPELPVISESSTSSAVRFHVSDPDHTQDSKPEA